MVELTLKQMHDFVGIAKNRAVYCEHSLRIRDEGGSLLPMRPRPGQLKAFAKISELEQKGKPIRLVVLKTRRSNFTAGICAEMFRNAQFWPGRKGTIIADRYRPAGLEAFGYLETFQENYVPLRVHEKAMKAPSIVKDTQMVMKWDTDSQIEVMSADVGEIRGGGRHDLLCDEAAFWRNSELTLAGALNMVPSGMPGTMVVVQSTANGVGGDFYDLCMKAQDPLNESGWSFLFFGWLEHTPYRTPVEFPDKLMRSLDKEERNLMDMHGATLEQLNWRRLKIATECLGKVDLFHQEYPTTPQEAFLTTGRPALDHKGLGRMVIMPGVAGELQVIQEFPRVKLALQPGDHGALHVFRVPELGRRYAAGADPSHGVDASVEKRGRDPDYAVAWISDADTGEQVAMLRERLRPNAFAEYLALLCQWYNWAYVCPEANDPGFIDALILKYRIELIYNRRRDPTDRRSIMPDEIGFLTTAQSRLWLVAAVDDAVREGTTMIHSAVALDEHYKFVIKPNGKAEALTGHDDTVLAHSFAIMMRRTMPRRTSAYVDHRQPDGRRPGAVQYGKRNRDDDED